MVERDIRIFIWKQWESQDETPPSKRMVSGLVLLYFVDSVQMGAWLGRTARLVPYIMGIHLFKGFTQASLDDVFSRCFELGYFRAHRSIYVSTQKAPLVCRTGFVFTHARLVV